MRAVKVLYLRDEELALFRLLPEEVKKGCNVEKETIEAYESPVDLKMRRLMVRKELPSVGQFLDEFCAIGHPKEMARMFQKIGKVSWVCIVNIFYAIGAIGLCPLVEAALRDAATQEDIAVVSKLSLYRHLQLQSNVQFLPPSDRA